MNTSPIGQWYVEPLERAGAQGLRALRNNNAVEVERADPLAAPGEFHISFRSCGSREERFTETEWREMLVVGGELLSRVSVERKGGRS